MSSIRHSLAMWKPAKLYYTCLGILVAALSGAAQPEPAVFISNEPGVIIASDQAWGELGLNTAAHAAGIAGQPLQIGDKQYATGLGHHANGSITVWLNGQFSAFDAEIGVQPCAGGSVVFRVLLDGLERFKSPVIRSGDAPVLLHVPCGDAEELRLEAHDAGDGITCDMANWAEARLTTGSPKRSPLPSRRDTAAPSPVVDIAPFGRVVTWDPARTNGSRASRIEEFLSDDLFTETELKQQRNGAYLVPVTSSIPGTAGCIGIQWLNRRSLRELGLEFVEPAKVPSTNSVRLEAWFGESAWQGTWKPVAGELELQNATLRFRPGTSTRLQTQKVRWVIRDLLPGTEVFPSAFTHSRWATTNLVIQHEKPRRGGKGTVSISNGQLIDPGQDQTSPVQFSLSRPLNLAVRYSRPSSLNLDPTVLQFRLPSGSVSVALNDVLSNGCVYVPDHGLFVAPEGAAQTLSLAQYKASIADRKTVLEQVRQMPDQTLDQAMQRTHHDFQSAGPVLLSLACDNTKFIVERDGIVRFHPEPFQWLGMHQQVDWSPWYANAGEVRPQFGPGNNEGLSRRLEGGWLPIPVISTTNNGIRYTQRTFVAPWQDQPGDALRIGRKSVCVIEFTIANVSPAAAVAKLNLSFLANSKDKTPAEITTAPQALLIRARERTVGMVCLDDTEPRLPAFSDGVLIWERELPPGRVARMLVCLPGEGLTGDELAKESGALDPAGVLNPLLLSTLLPTEPPSQGLRARAMHYWEDALRDTMQITTPDPLLNDLIRSSQVRCLIDARSEAEGARVGASIAAMAYGPLESEAHSVIRGMDYLGHDDFARRSLDFFIHRYTTNGFLTTGYTTFGTAWHLWMLGEHYQLTRDTNWVRQVAPEVARVCHWVLRQIDKTRRFTPSGEPVPEFGLMPPGVLADWNSFAYHFAMNAYYVAGLRGASLALRDIGHPDAPLFAKASEELRKNTLRAYARTQAKAPVLPLRDGTWIPHYPSQVHSPGKLAEFFPGQDAGRSWCYDVELGAHQLVPTGVLDPGSREVQRLIDHMEDVQFLSDGWFDYSAEMNQADWFNLGGFSKVQPYYTRNCEIYALRDDVKPFIRSYFNSIASLLNPEVMTFWEHFHHSGAWDKTHETGYFLHQTRTMLVQERGDDLWLAPFVPDRWLVPGTRVSVRNAPTRFGKVSYTLRPEADANWIEATIVSPKEKPPKRIVLRLRHPEGRDIRSVTVNRKPLRTFDPQQQTITLRPSSTGELVIRAEF